MVVVCVLWGGGVWSVELLDRSQCWYRLGEMWGRTIGVASWSKGLTLVGAATSVSGGKVTPGYPVVRGPAGGGR